MLLTRNSDRKRFEVGDKMERDSNTVPYFYELWEVCEAPQRAAYVADGILQQEYRPEALSG